MGNRVLGSRLLARLLKRCGIDPGKYRLLVDLFKELSQRKEMMSLGNDTYSLQKMALSLFVVFGLMGVLMIFADFSPTAFLSIFVLITFFQVSFVLIAEVAEVIVNPVERLVLAHEPVDSATWTSAKLTHLIRTVVYSVVGINLVPALAGVFLHHGDRVTAITYPVWHLLVALGAGLATGFFSCGLFGWLVRIVPVTRLKMYATVVQIFPIAVVILLQRSENSARVLLGWVSSAELPPRWNSAIETVPGGLPTLLGLAGFTVVSMAVMFGMRSLAVDDFTQTSTRSIRRAGARRTGRPRGFTLGRVVARLAGGQAGRAGFEFATRMTRRDWQFARNSLSLLGMMALYSGVSVWAGWRDSPFESGFSAIHFFPHTLGPMCVFACVFLAYGNDHKGIASLLGVPGTSLLPFLRGLHAALLFMLAVAPNLACLALTLPSWGALDSVLFGAYGVAVGSLYLGPSLRLIDGFPFGKPTDPSRRPLGPGFMLAGAIIVLIAVGMQYLLFGSPWWVSLAIPVLAAASFYLTKGALADLESRIRMQLDLAAFRRTALTESEALAITR